MGFLWAKRAKLSLDIITWIWRTWRSFIFECFSGLSRTVWVANTSLICQSHESKSPKEEVGRSWRSPMTHLSSPVFYPCSMHAIFLLPIFIHKDWEMKLKLLEACANKYIVEFYFMIPWVKLGINPTLDRVLQRTQGTPSGQSSMLLHTVFTL